VLAGSYGNVLLEKASHGIRQGFEGCLFILDTSTLETIRWAENRDPLFTGLKAHHTLSLGTTKPGVVHAKDRHFPLPIISPILIPSASNAICEVTRCCKRRACFTLLSSNYLTSHEGIFAVANQHLTTILPLSPSFGRRHLTLILLLRYQILCPVFRIRLPLLFHGSCLYHVSGTALRPD
jgi:hypothetical protein